MSDTHTTARAARPPLSAPVKLGLYAGILVALFLAAFFIARALAPADLADGWSEHASAAYGHSQEGLGHGIN